MLSFIMNERIQYDDSTSLKSHERKDCANLTNDLSLQHKVAALIPPVTSLVVEIKTTRKTLGETNPSKQTTEIKKFNNNLAAMETNLAPLLIAKQRVGT
jgi:hypothetical protein